MLHRVYRIRYPPLIEVGTSLSVIFLVKKNGRSSRIRTCDPLVPSEVLYQTEPCPDTVCCRMSSPTIYIIHHYKINVKRFFEIFFDFFKKSLLNHFINLSIASSSFLIASSSFSRIASTIQCSIWSFRISLPTLLSAPLTAAI